MWQRIWEDSERSFRLVAVAQDVQADRVRPVVEERGVTMTMLLDRSSDLARLLGFRIVPSGFFADADGIIRYRHVADFDVADPRVRWNLDRFLAGEPTSARDEEDEMEPAALELFAHGVSLYAAGDHAEALVVWRSALELDPDNFLVRSQIWAAEHPERFWPAVDRDWQELQLAREGYDRPLP